MRMLAAAVAILLMSLPRPAVADHHSVTPGDNSFQAFVQVETPEQASGGVVAVPHPAPGAAGTATEAEVAPASASGGAPALDPCTGPMLCTSELTCQASIGSPLGGVLQLQDGSMQPLNLGPCTPSVQVAAAPEAALAAPPQVTPGMVAEAFRQVDLPASELVVQPPNGRTLVNFATNFYTEQGSFTRAVTLLGQRVELRVHPDRYGWRFGDGHQSWTTTPGASYPDLEVTHDYQDKGVVHPSVDTAYAATFSVNGGAWQPVDGTVTILGHPVDLEVVTATPRLISGP